MSQPGLLLVYTGNGKGKTTAALGLVMRARGRGLRVAVVQFIKGKWKTGERVFAAERLPEVPFLVKARRNATPIWLAGRMDRIVVTGGKVLVVDYKSDARPPADPQSVHSGYLTQLGLYALVADQLFPGHTVEAAILWTGLESLMILPRSLLAKPVSAFTLER